MTGGSRFLHVISLIVAVFLLPLSLAVAPSAEASVTASRAVVAPASSHAALAARRALVRRETSFAAERLKGRAVAAKLARETGKLTPAELRSLAAKARESAQREKRIRSAGAGTAGANSAAAAPLASTDQVEGVPEFTWLVGPGGLIGECFAGCITQGMVTPGEPVTVFSEVFQEGSASTTVPVTVTWTQDCSSTVTIGTETVNAPGLGGGNQGAIASASFTVQDSCAGGSFLGQTIFLSVNATPQVSDPITGAGDLVAYWGSIPPSQLGACNCSADSAAPPAAQADAGDPVDTVSGAYAESVTDASLKSPGYPLVISRAYSSADTAPGALGPGWSLPWQANLAVNPSSGDVTFTAENGDHYVYVPNGSGGFVTAIGAVSQLSKVTDSSGNVTGYTLTTPGKMC